MVYMLLIVNVFQGAFFKRVDFKRVRGKLKAQLNNSRPALILSMVVIAQRKAKP